MSHRLSIVIPTLNRRSMLRHALDSIGPYDPADWEVIVVDGGSTDGTLDDLALRRDIVVLNGPDRGIYDAFNKGIARALGHCVVILNSDDAFESGALVKALAALEASRADAVCGAATLVENGTTIAVYDNHDDKRLTPHAALIGSSIINARLFRREAMLRVGTFDLSYPIVADRDWLLRWWSAGLKTEPLPFRLYRYQQHAGSLTFTEDAARIGKMQSELTRLLQHWKSKAVADPELARVLLALEGRILGRRLIDRLRSRDIAAVCFLLTTTDGHLSMQPMKSIATAASDILARSPKPTKKSRD